MRLAQLTILVITANVLASPASAQSPSVPPTEADIVADVFGNVANAPLACAWGDGPCVPWVDHLSPVPSAAVPPAAACSSGSATLAACYRGAIVRLKAALESGSVLQFMDAGARLRDTMIRAQATGGPAWLRANDATNLAAEYFHSRGIDLADLARCRSGDEASRYRCVAEPTGPSRATFRAAIDALEEHNAILVLKGRRNAAAMRALSIYESGSGPFAHHASTKNELDPMFRLGMPGLRSLAIHSFLRALLGDVATSWEAERTILAAHEFHPSTHAGGSSEFAVGPLLFAAARMATEWNPRTHTLSARQAEMDQEMKSSLGVMFQAVTLATVRGDALAATTLAGNVRLWANMMISSRFEAQYRDLSSIPMTDLLTDATLSSLLRFTDPCGWINPVDMVFSNITYGWVVDTENCDEVNLSGASAVLCPMKWGVVGVAIGITEVDALSVSLRDNYRALIDSWDGVPYDYEGDGETDLTYIDGEHDTSTILRAGVRADECKTELDDVSGRHSAAGATLTCTSQSDEYHGWDDGCEGQLTATPVAGGETFIPFPIAARICPDRVADVVGLNDDTRTGLLAYCATPYAYVSAVADMLWHDDAAFWFEQGTAASVAAGDETIATTIVDFATEAMLLSSPVAVVQQNRGDLAYIADNTFAGDCGQGSYTDCYGLDVTEARLEEAAHALERGLSLVERFGALGQPDWTTDGAHAIATLSDAAVGVCDSTGCGQNQTDHVRATHYRRLQEMLVTKHQVDRDRFEMIWRRIDIAEGECLVWSDTTGDGVIDTLACDTSSSCVAAPECELLVEAEAFVTAQSDDLLGLATNLDEQLGHLTNDHDLADFVLSLSRYTDLMAQGLDAQLVSLKSGTDWLGFRGERSYSTDDPAALGQEIEGDALALSTAYRDFVEAYVSRTTAEATFVAEAELMSAEADASVASFCADAANNSAPTGCGATDEWRARGAAAGYQLIKDINDGFQELCDLEVELPDYDGSGTTVFPVGDDAMAELGFQEDDACPELISPDLATWDDHTGSLALQLQQLEQLLEEIRVQLDRIHAQIAAIEHNIRTWRDYLDELDYQTEQADANERLRDSIVCITSGVVAAGMWVLTIPSAGVSTGAAVASTSAAISTCAGVFSDDVASAVHDLTDPEDLALLAGILQAELSLSNEVAQLIDHTFTLILQLVGYESVTLAYATELAAMERAIVMGDTTIEHLYTSFAVSQWLNPVATHFAEQESYRLKANFRGYARDIRRLTRAVEYRIGNGLPEGETYDIGSTPYYLPHLSEITAIASTSSFDQAVEELRYPLGTTPEDLEEAGALNLVAVASLVHEIGTQFGTLYGKTCSGSDPSCVTGDRFTSDVWIVGEHSLLDTPSNPGEFGNQGELALLGRSGFYAPQRHTCIDGTTTMEGWLDLAHYCDRFADGSTVDSGTCFDPYTMDTGERVSMAFLDHMIVGVGVEPFRCTRLETTPGSGAYEYQIEPAFDAHVVSYADLEGDPNLVYDGDSTTINRWDELASTDAIPNRFYNAQTNTVKEILERLVGEVAASPSLSMYQPSLLPGNYLFWIDTATAENDPEDQLLSGSLFTTLTSQAEHLESIALLCENGLCDDDSSASAQLMLLGNAWQRNRCYLFGGAQEAVSYQMGTTLIAGTNWTWATHDFTPPLEPMVESILGGSDMLGAIGGRPLHVSGMILSVNGLRTPEHDEAPRWVLFQPASPPAAGLDWKSRLRLRVRMSYFNTTLESGSSTIDVADVMPCQVPELALPIGQPF
ncbi:MAG: hypothetical protein AAGF12_20660 [Myxococcota bacterium]